MKNDMIICNWLYFNAFMVFCMAIIGAVTRLTESGLSITEWNVITGVIPPLDEATWVREFELYRQTPEYQKINAGMALADFKFIYFWEWFHRLWGRLIGLTYALPLIFFWVKGWVPNAYKIPFLGLLILGGLQGVMGWFMVMSGLVDDPDVSHFRLAAHLSLAFVIFGCLLWLAYSLSNIKPKPTTFCRRRHGWTSMAILAVTIIWGAFMAGQDAGLVSSSWPFMYQNVMIPDTVWGMNIAAFFNSPEIIHFTHRWIAVVALVMIATFAWRAESPLLGGMVFFQFVLGILTIMSYVAIPVAAMHQGGAFILTALLLKDLYALRA